MPQFTDKEWNQTIAHLAAVIGPDAKNYAALPVARLMAAIPYLANSEDPDRFALSNLLTFCAATKVRALFNHRPDDDGDVFRRLATIHVGNQADPKVVDYGMTLLALISLNDHEKDAAADKAAGKYNPVAEGKWVGSGLRTELKNTLNGSPSLASSFASAVGNNLEALYYWSGVE